METTYNRRDFLARASVAALAMSTWSFSPAQNKSLTNNLGLQLYTLREVLASDPMNVLKAVQQAGYKHVESMDSALLQKLQPVLKSMDLAVHSSHFSAPYITGNWTPMESFGLKVPEKKDFKHVIEQVQPYGLTYLVFPYIFPQDRGGLDMYKSLAEKLNAAGEICQSAGMQLLYHNHAFEFQPMENTSPFQVLQQELSPGLVNFELDLFWVSVAGLDPVSFMQEHQGRIKTVHLKDKKKGTPQAYSETRVAADSFQPVGAGTLDFTKILKTAQDIGVAYGFVEQDQSPDPLADIAKSARYLQKLSL